MSSFFSLVSIVLVVGAIAFFAGRAFPPAELEQGGGDNVPDAGVLAPIDAAESAKEPIESKSGVVQKTTAPAMLLDLSGQGLTKVPMEVFGRTDLTVLNVSHNALTGALQAEVRHLTNLTTLDLSHNQFTGVPAEVGQLKNLEALNLSYNKLTGLPYELGNLKNLKLLDLSGNAYSEDDLSVIKGMLPPTTVIKTE